MTPYPLIPPKVYPLVAHTRNKVFDVYLKQNSSKNDCLRKVIIQASLRFTNKKKKKNE